MRNFRSRTLAALMIIAAGVFAVAGQKVNLSNSMSETERSVRAFYDDYAEDLRQARREAIADRYDRRGAYLMGNGSKSLTAFEQIKDRYMTKWSGPKSFEWKDLSVDVLSKDAAAVLARFEWTTAAGKSLNFSYTGVLVKRDGKWRIRVEDESIAPPKPAAN
jgi:hypothetical protein